MVINTFHTEDEKSDSQIQKIKSYLDITHLKYVSDNIKSLLKIKVENDPKYFKTSYISQSSRKNGKIIYRVILYIRLSVEDGDVIEGDVSKSIRNQLLILLDECQKRNWTVVAIFCEEGISGVNDDRPEWKKSLKFCECGNTEIVLCKSQSRFSRSMEMIEKYLHNKFVAWNVRFVGLVDSSDTMVAGNKKARQINGLVNEWQVEDQSINIRAVLKNKQSNGLFTGSFAPYGYKKDPKDKYHFVIDEEAAKIVRKIFEMYANGNGVTKICNYLNENKIPIPSIYKHQKGLKFNCPNVEYDKKIVYQIEKGDTLPAIANKYQSTPKEILEYNGLKAEQLMEGQIITIPVVYAWRTNTIYNMLKNEVYIGTLTQHKNEGISYKNKKQRVVPKEERIVVPHCHKPIIDKETWEIVSKRFANKKSKKEKVRMCKNGKIHLFSGKIKCGGCAHTFYRDAKIKKEKEYAYWLCGNRYKTAKLLCHNHKSVNEMQLYDLVIKEINKQIEKYYDKEIVKKYYEEYNKTNAEEEEEKRLRKEREKLAKDLRKKEKIISLLYEDRIEGVINGQEFKMLKNKNDREVKEYQVRIERIEKEIKKLNREKVKNIDIEELLSKYSQIEGLSRYIIDEFILQIHIGYYQKETRTRKMIIEWNVK